MAVSKRDRKWYIKGRIKKDDGTYYQYHKLAKGCTLKKEAEEYERLFRLQYQDIKASVGHKSFHELSDEYIDTLVSQKKSTIISYKSKLKAICEKIGDKKINLITKEMLQRYVKELENEYSEEYVSKYFYVLRSTFEYAVLQGYIQTNPMLKVRRRIDKDTIKKEMEFWEPEEFERFINVVDQLEMKTFFIFLYWMGTRKGETCALQWKDIDFEHNIVRIYKSVTYKTKGVPYEITTPKTNNSNRNISMFTVVQNALKEWKLECKKMYGFNEECFVFGFSRPLSDNMPRRMMDKYIEKINNNEMQLAEKENRVANLLKRIRIHDFRHSHASYLINNMGKHEFTDFDIAKRLGDTVAMLHQTYAHQFKDKDKSIITALENNDNTNSSQAITQSNTNYITELKSLKELLDIGVITEDEFTMKKKSILGI